MGEQILLNTTKQSVDSIAIINNAVLERDRQFCQSRGATEAADLVVVAFRNSIL